MNTDFCVCDDFIYYIVNNEAVLYDYIGDKKIILLPTSIDGLPVHSSIADDTFATPTQVLWIVCQQPTEFGCFVFRHCRLRGFLGIRKFHDAPQQISLNDYSVTDNSHIPVEIETKEIVFNPLDDMEYTPQVCFPTMWEALKNDDPEALESTLTMYDIDC